MFHLKKNSFSLLGDSAKTRLRLSMAWIEVPAFKSTTRLYGDFFDRYGV